MRKAIWTWAGVSMALGLFAGTARAGETVFTDEGWYRVEGNAPTPQPDQNPAALAIEPAMPTPPTPAPMAMPPPGPAPMTTARPMGAPPPPAPAPSCLEERGALARRLLALHGLEVGKSEVTDEQLGSMSVANLAAPIPFTASLTLDPDLNLLEGNLPIPPSSANWDEETRQDWQALADCESD